MALPVRTLRADELTAAGTVVAHAMLGSLADDAVAHFVRDAEPDRTHGAFRDDGRLIGTARWFVSSMSTTGSALPAAAVTSVAVLNTDRRQGHLTRLMRAQLDQVAAAGIPVAVLIAAEAPIYGRFGYGPTAASADLRVDARAASIAASPTGRTTVVPVEELRPALEEVHDRRLLRTAGGITRPAAHWDRIAGVDPPPGIDAGQLRGALWHDDRGDVQGAVAYLVEEQWDDHRRPAGKATVHLLVGATPEAERELWRHVTELDWVATVEAPWRAVDDPLPLWLSNPRTVATVVSSDVFWARILDLPTTFGALRAPREAKVVAEVVDDDGYTSGTWDITVGPDGSEATLTDATAEVRLPISTLGACFLGGQAMPHLHAAGWLEELQPHGVDHLGNLCTTAVKPWCTTDF